MSISILAAKLAPASTTDLRASEGKRPRVGALDGWRGVAILLVLVQHFISARRPYSTFWGNNLGVTIFFVLSGYLITGNLLRDAESGKTNLLRFYIRRAYRLWPCAWGYLLFLFVLPGLRALVWRDALKCVFFARNFVPGMWITEHFWSLSIEEQFYLVWPAILIFCGRKKAAYVAFAGIIAVAIYRGMHWGVWQDKAHFIRSAATQFRADALLMGCLTAIVFFAPPERLKKSKYILICGISGVLISLTNSRISPSAEIVSIAAFIVFSLNSSLLGKVLSFKPLTALGRISYSLYVWQQIFYVSGSATGHAWILVFAIPTAVFSYLLIEEPFLSRAKGGHLRNEQQLQGAT